jgi:hypothetical protein
VAAKHYLEYHHSALKNGTGTASNSWGPPTNHFADNQTGVVVVDTAVRDGLWWQRDVLGGPPPTKPPTNEGANLPLPLQVLDNEVGGQPPSARSCAHLFVRVFFAAMVAVLLFWWWMAARQNRHEANDDECTCCCDADATPPYTRSAKEPVVSDFKQQIIDKGIDNMSVEALEAILKKKQARQVRARAALQTQFPVAGDVLLNDLRLVIN